MNVSRIFIRTQRLEVDACKRCQFLWFDGRELAALPAKPPEPKPKELPQAAREAVALAEVDRIRRKAEIEDIVSGHTDSNWQMVAGYLGLPVEHGDPGLKRYPVVTWIIALAVAIISAFGFIKGESFIQAFGFIPNEAFRAGGSTLFTSFFVHGGLFHLVSNLYFFLIFGDNVEDLIGRKRFLLLLAGSIVAGKLLHYMADPRGDVPLIGASGGISGIITLYALVFPQARIGIMFRASFFFRWVNVSARWALVLWLFLQFFIAWKQLSGTGNVSALGHLGGCCASFLYWLIVMRAAVPQTNNPPANEYSGRV